MGLRVAGRAAIGALMAGVLRLVIGADEVAVGCALRVERYRFLLWLWARINLQLSSDGAGV